MKNRVYYRGFTLIELLVTVAIIGLLASLVMLSLDSVKARSRDTRRIADVKSLRDALALYQMNFGLYPDQQTAAHITGSDALSLSLINNHMVQGPIIDPLNNTVSGVGYYYSYQSSSDDKTYVITYCLETNSIQGHTAGCNNGNSVAP